MNNSDSAVVSRFRVICMIIMLAYVSLLGSSGLYFLYTGQQSLTLFLIPNVLFLLSIPFILKDWIRYWKISKRSESSGIVNDELFRLHNVKAMNIGFISMLMSQLALILFDIIISPIDGTIAGLFSLVLGGCATLFSLIMLELWP